MDFLANCARLGLHPWPSAEPIVALWTTRSGHTLRLCQLHLDYWLDVADDDPELEPAELVFAVEEGCDCLDHCEICGGCFGGHAMDCGGKIR